MKKRMLLMLAIVSCAISPASAQFSLSDAFGALFGGNSTSSQTQNAAAADNLPTKKELAAKWTYSSSAVEYRGDNALAGMAVNGLRSQLADAYVKAGLTKGCGTIQFKQNGKVTARMQEHEIEGTYSYDASTGGIVLRATVEGQSVECSGCVSLSQGELTLLLDVNEALAAFKAAFPDLAEHQYVKSVEPIISSIPGLYAGGVFSK